MSVPVVVICGPTGSGKSSLAVHLAQIFSGEVMNCDSLQVYRHFDIGTAKLPEEQRGEIRHHLIDVVEAHQGFTAGDFTLAGRAALREVSSRGNLPIVAGGTGFYLRALFNGLPQAPPGSAVIRTRLADRERRRPGSLHPILIRLDPISAKRIHKNDIAKLIRALEIRILSSKPASEQPEGESLAGYRLLKLGVFPSREQLYSNLDARATKMISDGLIHEVESILARGISRDAKPFLSLGYKEALAILDQRLTPNAALEQMQRETRRYAKRQFTWFRHEPGIVPLHGFGSDPEILAQAGQLVQAFLNPGKLE